MVPDAAAADLRPPRQPPSQTGKQPNVGVSSVDRVTSEQPSVNRVTSEQLFVNR